MPYKDRNKRLEYMRLYNRDYCKAHQREKAKYNKRYLTEHREENRERSHEYYSGHKQELLERNRIYRSVHREELRQQKQKYYLAFGQEFMDGVYGHLCFFCGQEVLLKDLARHHINGDGNEERGRLGGPGKGTYRSWRQAIAEQNPTKWATSHNGCHTRFHKLQKVKESRAP